MSDDNENLPIDVVEKISEITKLDHVASVDQTFDNLHMGYRTSVWFDDQSRCGGTGDNRMQSAENALLAAKTHIASRFGRD